MLPKYILEEKFIGYSNKLTTQDFVYPFFFFFFFGHRGSAMAHISEEDKGISLTKM
jgi:hypothetical protein